MARGAPIEPGDVAKVIVERELGEPDLVDPKRAVERIEHGQLEQALANIAAPLIERLLQLHQLRPMIGDTLGRRILGSSQLLQQRLQRLAVRVGRLEGEAGVRDLLSLDVGESQQHRLAIGGRLLGDREFVVGPRLVEFGPSQFQAAGQVVLAELDPLDDVPKPSKQVAPQHHPLVGVLLRPQLVDVKLCEVRRLLVFGHSPHLGDEGLDHTPIQIRATRVDQRLLKRLPPRLVRPRILLFDSRPGRPGFQFSKLLRIRLPRPVVVGGEQHDGGAQQQHRHRRKHHVQGFEIPGGLFGCGHGWLCRLGDRGAQVTGKTAAFRSSGIFPEC